MFVIKDPRRFAIDVGRESKRLQALCFESDLRAVERKNPGLMPLASAARRGDKESVAVIDDLIEELLGHTRTGRRVQRT